MCLIQTIVPESQAIAEFYKLHHPGVIMCDLNLDYRVLDDCASPCDDQDPCTFDGCFDGECVHEELTRYCITPCKFKEVFIDGPSAFVDCLNAHPDALCFVTTRGIPAVITDQVDQDPPPGLAGGAQPTQGMYASLESALMRLKIGALGQGSLEIAYDSVPNPFGALDPVLGSFGQPDDWVAPELDAWTNSWITSNCSDPEQPCPRLYAVSRLDSAAIYDNNPGYGTPTKSSLECIKELILRSTNLRVNKYAVTVLVDSTPSELLGINTPPSYTGCVVSTWLDRWCTLADDTCEFINGSKTPDKWPSCDNPQFDDFCVDSPCSIPATGVTCQNCENYTQADIDANQWPFVAIATTGRNGYFTGNPGNPPSEQPNYNYISCYDPNPAGIFLSVESFNGWTIHSDSPGQPDQAHPSLQGQVMDWIAAGGSFTCGNVQEPGSVRIYERTVFKSMLVAGRQWGEASLAALPKLGQFQTPLGDPLARIIAYDPDIWPEGDGDRQIDHNDLNLVTAQYGQSGPGLSADINHDGVVNALDRSLVFQAWGRNCVEPPVQPTPGVGCGDFDENFIVDQTDVAIFYGYVAAQGGFGPCPLLENWYDLCDGDLNGDAVVDQADETIVTMNAMNGLCFNFDIDGDGEVNTFDYTFIFLYVNNNGGSIMEDDPAFNSDWDLNCDGVLDDIDVNIIRFPALEGIEVDCP